MVGCRGLRGRGQEEPSVPPHSAKPHDAARHHRTPCRTQAEARIGFPGWHCLPTRFPREPPQLDSAGPGDSVSLRRLQNLNRSFLTPDLATRRRLLIILVSGSAPSAGPSHPDLARLLLIHNLGPGNRESNNSLHHSLIRKASQHLCYPQGVWGAAWLHSQIPFYISNIFFAKKILFFCPGHVGPLTKIP